MSRDARALRSLALIVAVSGAAGLTHEVVWARALGQTLGHSLQSLTAVLVAFLGGLGLGAVVASRRAGRTISPLRAFAALEVGIAAWGVASPWIARGVREGIVAFTGAFPTVPYGMPLRFAAACLAIAPLTLAMGATFPFLIREGRRRGAESAACTRTLYGWNTIGGALGAGAGSFLLLPWLGTEGAFQAAAAGNLIAACAALASSRRRAAPTPEAAAPEDEVDGAAPGRARRRVPASLIVAITAAALSGAAGGLLQLGWTRAMTLAFGSSVFALGISLTAYILGIGIGPLIVTRRILRPGRETGVAAVLFWIVGASSLALLPAFGRMPVLAAHLSGRLDASPVLMLAAQFAVVFLCLLVPTLAQGAAFPVLVLIGEGNGRVPSHRAAALVYGVSTWGLVAGLGAGGLLLIPAIGAERSLRAAACGALLLSLIFALPGLARGRASRPRPLRQAAATALMLMPWILLTLPRWDRDVLASGGFLYGPVYKAALGRGTLAELMRRRGEVLYENESGEALVTVRRSRAGVLSLQINGRTEASTGGDMGTQLLSAHLPMLLHPRPQDVLIVGLASGVTAGAAARYPARHIRVVEIVPAVVEAGRLFSSHNGNVLDDPRLRIVLDDARAHLLTARERYDVIISQPSNPWIAGVANLFTVEFYELIRAHMRPGGLFCQWVQAYRIDPADLRGIVASFLHVFPEATLWEESAGSGDYFLIGGDRPVRVDAARLHGPEGSAAFEDLERAGIRDDADLLARFVAGPRELGGFSAQASLQTDDRLDLERRAPLALFRRTLRDQVAALNRHRQPVLPLIAQGDAIDPGLVERLGRRLREREVRLGILEGLEESDLGALADPFMAAGLDALRAGRFVEAIPALQRAATQNPDSGAAGLLLGEAYRASGLAEAAAVVLRETVAMRPNLAAAWNALGRSLWTLGRAGEARAAFEEAIRRGGPFAAARNNLGIVLLESGDPIAARRAFESALVDDPQLAAAHANLGLALKRSGDSEGAERSYRAALALDPLNTDARYNLAELLRATAREEAARDELTRILAIDPSDEQARSALDEMGASAGGGSSGVERRRRVPAPAPGG